MITDRMIHEIMHAELVVADLTYLNANAFYELGIRHAAEKPVIHFAQFGTKLPFDAINHRAVIQDITSWDGIERARLQIREAAKAIEAPGYRVSNPITQANASFQMLESADPSEQLLADLRMRVERLEARDLGERLHGGRMWPNELLSRLPDTATDVDRMLIAGYIAQQGSANLGFSLEEANSLLDRLGLQVHNPSQLLKENLLAKRVFKHQGRYRVSQIGVEHLRLLMLLS
jgi:hypothetical protein